MSGGDTASPQNQIYINNWAILDEALDVVNNNLGFDILESRIGAKMSGGKTNPIGYGGGDLTGVPLVEAGVMRSPCRALRWMQDNSDYYYETFVDHFDNEGCQGLDVFSKDDGSLVKTVSIEMHGGPNADLKDEIYVINKRIITAALMVIHQSL